jgi:hypothetical protein
MRVVREIAYCLLLAALLVGLPTAVLMILDGIWA